MNAVSRLCLTKEPCLGSYPGFGIGGRGAYPVHPRRPPQVFGGQSRRAVMSIPMDVPFATPQSPLMA